jgi:hypothetical protein
MLGLIFSPQPSGAESVFAPGALCEVMKSRMETVSILRGL